jgi:hypothetical protein
MQTKSNISAAALAAALLVTPQAAHAQLLGLDVDLDVLGIEADADVDVGGDSLLDADVDIGTAGSGSNTSASTSTESGSDSSLVDIDIGGDGGSATGPNGGTLIDLTIGRTEEAVLDADLDVLNGGTTSGGGSSLITGDVRIGALGHEARKDALLGLIHNPHLAGLDLDAAIDDRRVAIVAVVDLLGRDSLADIRAAIDLGGHGRTELLDALSASVELGAILGSHGIDPADVLAVQVAENGATEVIVLDGAVDVALLGDDGDIADLTADELANLDVDLLSRDELAEIDLDLLPDDLRTTAQLRLLGSDSDDADLTPAELASIDLDLLSRDELAELDVALLPEPLGAAVNLRLLGDDGDLSDASVGDLAALDLSLLPGTDDGAGTGGGGDDGENGGGTATPPPTPAPTPAPSTGGGENGNDDRSDGATGNAGTGGMSPGAVGGAPGAVDNTATAGIGTNGTNAGMPVMGTLPQTQVGASFSIAALDCEIGVLALASGLEATPQAIAGADALELVRIDGCQRSLVDGEAAAIRAAIGSNPAISGVLDEAQIPLDQVIGATIQGGTLTLFIEPTIS